MSNARLDEFTHLWDGSESGWVLVRTDRGPNNFSIFNEAGHMLLIEDEALHAAVVDAMRVAGVPIRDGPIPRPADVSPAPPRRKRQTEWSGRLIRRASETIENWKAWWRR